MNKILLVMLACLLTGNLFAQAPTASNNHQQPGITSKHRVIIQLSSADTMAWKGLMNNVKHIKDTWGDSVQVEVVVHGPGIDFLVAAKTTEQKRITEAKSMGVVFNACQNSMKAKNLLANDMLGVTTYVASGVVEVIMKQEDGWSYLKSGF